MRRRPAWLAQIKWRVELDQVRETKVRQVMYSLVSHCKDFE